MKCEHDFKFVERVLGFEPFEDITLMINIFKCTKCGDETARFEGDVL